MRRYPLRSVLAAIEVFDRHAEVALRSAARFAALVGAEVHVVVCAPNAPDAAEPIAGTLGDHGITAASIVLRQDDVVDAVREHAAAAGADLIVLGDQRARGAWHDVLGSTADRVVRAVNRPCLLAKAGLATPLRTVVLPTDFSVPAQRSVALGLAWVCRASEAAGVHATASLLHVSGRASSVPVADVEPLLEREISRAAACPREVVGVQTHVVSADRAAEGIERFVAGARPDLVVAGTHGYNWLTRALMGSTASHLARSLPCSILLVPPKRSEKWWIPDANA